MKVAEFLYDLPDVAIAQSAMEPRDSARLLDTRDMSDRRFSDLPSLLRQGDLVVVNTTRVRRARLKGKKVNTGGAVELLLLGRVENGFWEAMVKPARRIKAGTTIDVGGVAVETMTEPRDGLVTVDIKASDVDALLDREGEMPLPPYFRGVLSSEDRYQTIFAREAGSAAAPTAGLHFTSRVVRNLEESGIGMASVDLHVGIDTFRPMTAENLEDHRMHTEWCHVPQRTAEAIARARELGGRIVAVGTTTTRALESFAEDDGGVSAGTQSTDLFLRPGSRFRAVDMLITNFHVPGSSLVALVAGFMGEGWREAYAHALRTGYRFLSFGDAMLCRRAESS